MARSKGTERRFWTARATSTFRSSSGPNCSTSSRHCQPQPAGSAPRPQGQGSLAVQPLRDSNWA